MIEAPSFLKTKKNFKRYKDVSLLVSKHKNHPALLYWNLGNEIYYPYLYNTTNFYINYNSLIDLIHDVDNNHPVSTSTIGANKLEVVSIITRSPSLDFISFNSFGIISTFRDRLRPITPVWNGPHVITEWGVNGPWEAKETSWGVPIEETSTKKAEQMVYRHMKYINPLRKNNSLGSFVFYWGQKNEVTPTWYSLFDGRLKSESVFRLGELWNGKSLTFPGPQIDYILLEDKGAADNIVLSPGEKVEAVAKHLNSFSPTYIYHWEVREESWYSYKISKPLAPNKFSIVDSTLTFTAPETPGPYRLHLKITNNTGYFASANIPFYVLQPSHEE